jgi:DNA-binding MarR family transcriptional regulator/GNAT superfamily N-acetyltransferase
MRQEDIQQVRRFNRLVTQRIGALEDSYLSRGRPLGEARLIFEIGGRDACDLGALRRSLNLDSGYLSRLLRSLEGQDVIELRNSEGDGRARSVSLTAKGREEFAAYDALSDGLAGKVLDSLDDARRQRLVAAMGEVERLLRLAAIEIAVEPPESAEGRWCLEQYFAELDVRFEEGFDPGKGGHDPADMIPPAGWLLVARLDGEPVGCGVLKRLDDGIGEIKRVWTAPSARGLGVAGRLMDRLETLAREAGFGIVRLDTNKALSEAQAMYARRGYAAIERYNDNPYAHHWFEKRV